MEEHLFFMEVALKTVLSKLWDYQQAIVEIAKLNRELKQYPDSIKALEKEVKTLEKKLGTTKEELTNNKETQKKREEYLEMCKKNLEKYESDLMEVTNQKDYSLVLNEIDYAKKEIQTTEEELIKLIDEIETQEKEIEQLNGMLEEKNKELSEALESFESSNEEKVKKREQLTVLKGKLEKEIPIKYLKVFYTIAKKRNGVGIAKVEGENCSACHMRLRPQMINEMKKNPNALYYCDHCQRILVLEIENDNNQG